MGQTMAAKSKDNIYPIPAIGLSIPVKDENDQWRFSRSLKWIEDGW